MLLTTQTKITLLFSTIVGFLVVLLNVLIFESANQTWQRQEAAYMKAAMEAPMGIEDARKRFQDLQVTDSEGKIVVKQGIFENPPEHVPFTSYIFRDTNVTQAGEQYYYWGIQAHSGGLTYTTVDDITDIIMMRSMIVERAFWISLIGMLVILIIGQRFSAYVLRPIRDMNQATQSFSLSQRGELPIVPIYGNKCDEVVLLARSLEHLFARVHWEVQRLEQFSDDIAHEIKNRLFELLSSLDVMRSLEHQEHALTQAKKTIKQLSNVVDALLFFSRNEVGSPVAVPLLPLLRGHMTAEDARIRIPGEEKATFELFPDLFMTAIGNIVSNAQKFTAENGTITLTVHPDRLTIADTWVGIEARHLPYIFDRMYQADSARTHGSGHGLGLAIARKILEDFHGMKLSVESTVGQGTTFTVWMGRQEPV